MVVYSHVSVMTSQKSLGALNIPTAFTRVVGPQHVMGVATCPRQMRKQRKDAAAAEVSSEKIIFCAQIRYLNTLMNTLMNTLIISQ